MSFAYWVSKYNRQKKWRLFLDLMKPGKATTVLDAGFSDEEWSDTDNFLEKNYQYPENITALGIDTPRLFLKNYPNVKTIHYDGGRFPFSDKQFDICWSNAVLEHVGGHKAQVLFLKEIQRVARRAFITTPNKNFPIEIHTRTPLLHFLPKKIFDGYLKLVGKSWATGDYMRLLTRRDIERLLRAAGVSSYKILKNRLSWFILNYIIIFGHE